MTKTRSYKHCDYEQLVETLKEAELYDEVWEARENIDRKIQKDPESIIVMIDEDRVIGCVFVVEDGWNAFIWRLAIRKEYRNKGLGHLLMQKAEDLVVSRGFKEISLFVLATNDDLKDWYKKQKYISTKDYTFLYKKLI